MKKMRIKNKVFSGGITRDELEDFMRDTYGTQVVKLTYYYIGKDMDIKSGSVTLAVSEVSHVDQSFEDGQMHRLSMKNGDSYFFKSDITLGILTEAMTTYCFVSKMMEKLILKN